ncbi:hypothetical protein OHT77_23375 [Streptomyces sp. NBC_00252]|uniref:hypothetical protein n=1 Tax=Streptomyces sp. NBC_00252 TaxID=2975691 RepID=UPI002E2D757C|nr:hypothetical protein [Streptomyces sp. NBC_00252]
METLAQADWEAALLRLLEDVYTFAATGPKTDTDWQSDMLAVMNREVNDPRGWHILDWDKKNVEEREPNAPSFPFLPLSHETLATRLFPVTPDTAARLLVTMTFEWGPVEPEKNTQEFLADARTVLNRYGDNISCYTNITDARISPSPDLTTGVHGWTPLTRYDGDFGLVVVSPEEVGVFWSFNPI